MECAGDSNTNAEDSAVENIARIANAVQSVSQAPKIVMKSGSQLSEL